MKCVWIVRSATSMLTLEGPVWNALTGRPPLVPPPMPPAIAVSFDFNYNETFVKDYDQLALKTISSGISSHYCVLVNFKAYRDQQKGFLYC